MGIGAIESSVASGSVRSTSAKPVAEASSASGAASVQPVDEVVRVVKASDSASSNNNQDNNSNNQEGMNEGVPIQEVSKEKVESALRDINSKIRPTHTECQFSYHEETKRISIKVLDQDSGEVIREIPPEKTLDMIARTLELAGILVDEKR